jgi:hypothetical protein
MSKPRDTGGVQHQSPVDASSAANHKEINSQNPEWGSTRHRRTSINNFSIKKGPGQCDPGLWLNKWWDREEA